MTIQVEPETMTWLTRRAAFTASLSAALALGDFSAVPTAPYAGTEPGTEGFPKTDLMSQKLIDGMADISDSLNAAGQMSILLQSNTLEAFRRMFLSSKQSRREYLAHAYVDSLQIPKYTNLMLQQFVNTSKVSVGSAT